MDFPCLTVLNQYFSVCSKVGVKHDLFQEKKSAKMIKKKKKTHRKSFINSVGAIDPRYLL